MKTNNQTWLGIRYAPTAMTSSETANRVSRLFQLPKRQGIQSIQINKARFFFDSFSFFLLLFLPSGIYSVRLKTISNGWRNLESGIWFTLCEPKQNARAQLERFALTPNGFFPLNNSRLIHFINAQTSGSCQTGWLQLELAVFITGAPPPGWPLASIPFLVAFPVHLLGWFRRFNSIRDKWKMSVECRQLIREWERERK